MLEKKCQDLQNELEVQKNVNIASSTSGNVCRDELEIASLKALNENLNKRIREGKFLHLL